VAAVVVADQTEAGVVEHRQVAVEEADYPQRHRFETMGEVQEEEAAVPVELPSVGVGEPGHKSYHRIQQQSNHNHYKCFRLVEAEAQPDATEQHRERLRVGVEEHCNRRRHRIHNCRLRRDRLMPKEVQSHHCRGSHAAGTKVQERLSDRAPMASSACHRQRHCHSLQDRLQCDAGDRHWMVHRQRVPA